jgi:hypothetical protein
VGLGARHFRRVSETCMMRSARMTVLFEVVRVRSGQNVLALTMDRQ